MNPRHKNDPVPPSNPTSFPQTPPPPGGPDMSTWLLNAVNQLGASTARIEARLDSIDGEMEKLSKSIAGVEGDMKGHGNWLHTLKVMGGLVLFILGWAFVNAVWPWLKARLEIPG